MLNNLTDTQKQWGLIALVLLIILIVYTRHQKKKKDAEDLATIRQNIAGGTGGIGNGAVSAVTSGVEANEDYYPAQDAKQIWASGCNKLGFCWGGADEDTVISVLKNNVKTKANLKQLDQYFNANYEMSLDNFFKDYFYQVDLKKIYPAMNSLA